MSAAEVNEQWQRTKADEKQRDSVTDGLPPGLPALLYADKVLERLELAGRQVAEVAASSDVAEDRLGERLVDLVREARAEGIDPEQALRAAVRRLL